MASTRQWFPLLHTYYMDLKFRSGEKTQEIKAAIRVQIMINMFNKQEGKAQVSPCIGKVHWKCRL